MASHVGQQPVPALHPCSTCRPHEGSCCRCQEPAPACSTHMPKSDSLARPHSTTREPQQQRSSSGFCAQRQIRAPPCPRQLPRPLDPTRTPFLSTTPMPDSDQRTF
ncbi:UNVERIFIED_CONTAM: hypothetical protein K2H54_066700 [Gekko kuhli]